LVARLDACPKETPCDGYNIPIEIQIRSVFEDAWGEIDHKYGYVIRSGKDTGKPINNPEFVLSHLKVLKRFSDACMEYADAIRTEAVGVPPQLVATKKVVPVASDSLILDKFRSLGVSEGLIERYVEARTLKDDSAVLMEQDIGRGKEQYLSAAELFRELVSQISPESSSGEQLFYYYLRMNEALCLMSTNERDQVVAAHGIYQSLEGRYPDYPLLKMRLGQSLGKLGHLDAAIVFLRQAGEMAAQAAQEYGGKSSAAWPDWLPHVDYEHIAHTQPKLLGYHIWLKIHTMSHRDEKLMGELFEEAYNVTWKGLGAVQHQPKQELSLHNNLLYFSLGMLTRISTLGADGHVDERAILDRVEQHIAYIEKHVADIKDLQVSAVDTLMRAYSILERQTEAVRAAEILLDNGLVTSESPETTTELDANERLNAVGLARRVIKGEIVNLID
jgi:tetratricopeptide (TPR) repeat protein